MVRHREFESFRNVNELTAAHFESEVGSEILENPQRHLLTQEQIFECEGGVTAFMPQLAAIGVGFGILHFAKPSLFKYLFKGMLRKNEWFWLGTTVFVGHKVGYEFGISTFGDAQKLQNHWTAYYFQKALNRQEGKNCFMKAKRY